MIESPLLSRFDGYIDGAWAAAGSGKTFDVRDPATGEVLAAVPAMGEAETVAAVDAAAAAQERPPSVEERTRLLRAVHDRLLENEGELARIITREQGKPLGESRSEVQYAAGFFRFFAGVIGRLEPRTLEETIRSARWTVYHRPAGVVALITPWNFPLAMLAKKLSAALAAGCAVVAKPAGQTPLTTVALWAILERIGVPPGLLNLVVGPSEPIGRVFCRHPAVRIISFTGSTEIGTLLYREASSSLKRLALELGGNAPYIVFEDADVLRAAEDLIPNKFRAGGQTCVCTNRVYVHERAAESFTSLVADRVRGLRVGNGMEPGVEVGPLIDRAGFDKVAEHVAEALSGGARRLVGDDPPRPAENWGAFYPPTVLTGITPRMRLCREETFGPVVAISTFMEEARVLEAANSTHYGLAAYLFTRDSERAERVTRALRFGHVGVNTGTGPTPEAPFGGMKHSGFGREGGLEGLFEFTETQTAAARTE